MDAQAALAGSASVTRILGGELAWIQRGSGPTVLLLHKLGGHLGEWRRLVPLVAARCSVVAIDLPGHGRSRMHGDPPFVVSHESIAAEIAFALDDLGAKPPWLTVGSSVGASIALTIAALYPTRVGGVVSLGAALAPPTPLEKLRLAASAAIAAGEYTPDEQPLPRPIERIAANFGLADASIAQEMDDTRRAAGRWVAPLARSVAYADLPALLARVSAPVTLAFGVRGNYAGYAEEARRHWLPHATRMPIPDCGAFPHEERPAAAAAVILDALTVSKV